MTAEELAAHQRAAEPATDRVARDVARWASSHRLTPVTMAAFSVAFAVIAAVWLTAASARAEAIALAALLAAWVTGRAGRLMGGQQAAPATEWARAGCAALTELVVYAGIAGGASVGAAAAADAGLTGPIGSRLRGTSLAGFGAPGWAGVWRLAVAAVIVLALLQVAGICRSVTEHGVRPGRVLAFAGTPGGGRLLLAGGAVLLAGARVTFLLLLAVGVLALCAILLGRSRSALRPPDTAGYRGDGPLAVWIGQFVNGRLPPLPPLLVGLLVTGMLTALGLQNLPGILVLTPVEAMLLASLGSWHPHNGRRDWLVPPLLQAGEYVFLAALGFAGRVSPPVTFALIAAVALRHLDLAYRARSELMPSPSGPFVRREGRLPADRRGFGWDGRMIIAGIAAAAGILPMIYPLLALYLWQVLARDWITGWSAGHAAVHG